MTIAFDSDYRMLIGGSLVNGLSTFKVVNPANDEVFAEAPDASRSDLDRAVASARAAFPSWASTPIEQRRAAINALAEGLLENLEPMKSLLTREQGKPHHDSAEEVAGAAAWLTGAASLEIPVIINEDSAVRYSETRHVPLGVVAAIAPWNYPLILAAFKLGPALLAGNCVVLKPSPFTPLTALKLGEIAADLFPAGVLNVVSGGDDLGPWMTSHPDVDKVSFTGSTATGRRVMASASDTLKRITLELGGNDPAIVMHDIDPKALAEPLFWAGFGNAGQICIASKRIYVHAAVYDELAQALVDYAATVKVGDGAEQGTQIGPINNRPQFDRLRQLLDDAKTNGYHFLAGGEPARGPGNFLPITILDNPPEDSRIVREEQFGPIMPLIKFDDYDDVIARANSCEYGLGASVWGANEDEAWAIAERIESGSVWVNETRHLSPFASFAGHKQSGHGVENGLAGLLEFTIPKTLTRKKHLS
jgi:aldehyde dehydrogenase (NAD+)